MITIDAKGIVMLPEDLREETRKQVKSRQGKLETRTSPGEKPNAKRMATVAAVSTIEPFERTPEDIVADLRPVKEATPKPKRPRPENKRVWASVAKEPEEVIAEAFEEALRRDPDRTKGWGALVDGNKHPIKLLRRYAKQHKVQLTIILEVIHVVEYLWKAAWAFFPKGCLQAEAWVRERFLEVLRGRGSYVAAGIRRSATRRSMASSTRKPIDACADYLLKYQRFFRYDRYRRGGYPIATGVIEGACRHLIKDRMDLTGVCWRLQRAEAVLRLRSLRSSGDFEEYWSFHLERERDHNHAAKYAGPIPMVRPCSHPRPRLRRVK